ncbi:MAG: sugar transferase [Sanguibacteroides justesenii]|nr:sugar transferase [Sanguibacteroides justesenii]
MKQLMDYIVAALVLLLCWPLLLYIAIRIRMQGTGSVFYQQERLGKGGIPFRMVKFRTMVADAEDGTPLLAVSDDCRVTPFGRTLRKHHLDELPQFWNVLKGDMSIVGNRPLPLYEAELLTTDEYIERFMAPAGLTGLWQVEKRGDQGALSAEERKQLDIKYARNFSFGNDIKIICKTFTAFVQKENV